MCTKLKESMKKVALVIDIRGGKFLNDFFPGLDYLEQKGLRYEILFLDTSDEVLIKRFKESRRNHPLSPDGRIIDGIKDEREVLKVIKSKSTNVIDTSNLLPKQLKQRITEVYLNEKDYTGVTVNILSFGFKYGIPIDADLVFDVRFIPNPYYIEAMKRQSGLDEEVRDYVLGMEQTKIFFEKLMDMLIFLIPNYENEGKFQLVIGIGCTGGRHRSVAIAEKLKDLFKENDFKAFIQHRDIKNDYKISDED